MSYYEVLLFLHISAAVTWIGSGFFLQMLILRAERTSDQALTGRIAAHAGWLAQRIFIPSSLVVLVLGILLTIEGPWSFDQLWIVLGLAGYAASFLVGILFLEPEGKRIDAANSAHGLGSPQSLFHIRRINVVSRMELVVLFVVIGVMAVKPTADDVGALLIGGLAVAGAFVYGLPKLRGGAPEAAAAVPAD